MFVMSLEQKEFALINLGGGDFTLLLPYPDRVMSLAEYLVENKEKIKLFPDTIDGTLCLLENK